MRLRDVDRAKGENRDQLGGVGGREMATTGAKM